MRTSLLILSAVLLTAPVAVRAETQLPSAPAELCSTLDGAALDTCIGKQAKIEGDALAKNYRGAVAASDKACSALPSPAIGACLERAKDAADQVLNKVYRDAMASIDEGTTTPSAAASWKAQLKAAQQQWVAFRDADCGKLIDSEWQNGTGTGAAIESCLLSKTLMRAEELRSRYTR